MIRQMRLQNFKCFEDQTLGLGNLTLLTGLNGMGKSTVIQALLLLRQSYQQNLLPSTGLALNGDLIRIGTARDALFEDAKSDTIAFSLQWQDEVSAEWAFRYDPLTDVLTLVPGSPHQQALAKSLFAHDFQYLKAERVGPRSFFEMSDYVVRQREELGPNGEYTAHFLSLFGNRVVSNPHLWHTQARSSDLRDQVEAWLSEVSPGTRLTLKPHAGTDLISLFFEFATVGNVSNTFRSTNVGFGLTYVLSIFTALLAARPGALLLLENPEAHLHPKGQARIGELIAYAAQGGVQVVVETHSDHVLNGVRMAVHADKLDAARVRLHFFRRTDAGGSTRTEVVSPRMDARGRIDIWPDGFFDEWDRSLEALLGPKGGE